MPAQPDGVAGLDNPPRNRTYLLGICFLVEGLE